MKAIIFNTGTPDTTKLVSSFTSLGHESHVFEYCAGKEGIDMVGITQSIRPDFVIYIGAIRAIHHSYVPTTETLCQINRVSPMVHICSDAADSPWWADLEEYNAAGAFKLQVTIDGSYDNPIGKFGLVALTPVDPNLFTERAWSDRPHRCGWSGGLGVRQDIIGPMQATGCVTILNVDHQTPYDQMCDFYTHCQTVINDARTGSTQHRHVKGRFVEAGLAGAVTIEPADSPAQRWFTPGVDYLSWSNPGEAIAHVIAAQSMSTQYESMGKVMRQRMLERHAAPVFWNNVMHTMGL